MSLVMMFLMAYADTGNANLAGVNQGVEIVYEAVVRDDGTVDYATLASNPELMGHLTRYVTFMATYDPEPLNDKTKIAVLSNTYNVFTLVGVMRKWPVASVRKIHPFFGFFTKDIWVINGKKQSLNKIEGMIRDLDPRIHFIINCASASCPALLPEIITEDNVTVLMDQASKSFILDQSKNQFDRTKDEWRLSKIFEWYAKDFGGEKAVVDFIVRYHPELGDWRPKKIRYNEYDWALNGPTEAP